MRKIIFIISLVSTIVSCNYPKNKQSTGDLKDSSINLSGNVIVFHAGSLAVPMKMMKDSFEKYNPQVRILLESAGSVACARKITDLKQDCDIMASADYEVIDKMLIPEYADFNIKFASNELGIAFTEKARYAADINSENWYKFLSEKEVIYGRSDPNTDPCGYRTVLMWQLAEKFYHKKGFENEFLKKNKEYIRPKEVDLLALMDAGAIDYMFIYRSVAIQHNLKFVALPDSLSFISEDLADFYKTAIIEINGKKPGLKEKVYGSPIEYGITMLKKSPNRKNAEAFLDYILSEKGKQILEKQGQTSLIPSKCKSSAGVPVKFKKYILQ